MSENWEEIIFNVNEESFARIALEVFRFQYEFNPIYREFVDSLHVVPSEIHSIEKIPFLPFNFFKTREVKTTRFDAEAVFESSGTTGAASSRHFVKDISVYR